jgi:hypothetical protein
MSAPPASRALLEAPPLLDAAIAELSLANRSPWRPGRRDAWWWLALPLAIAVALVAIYAVAPDFYGDWVLPEGYGFLEVTQFLECMAGFGICLWILERRVVKGWPLLWRIVLLLAVVCLYIGGEEMSWGQHWFGWGTPEVWGGINRQDETNLHNTNYVFNQLPQLILEIGIAIGGIILPLLHRVLGRFQAWFLNLFAGPLELLPVALLVFSIKGLSTLQKKGIAVDLLQRPSEAMELYYYMFILFYLVVLARRIMLLDSIETSA